MKRLAIALIAVLAAVSTAPAVPPLTMTVLGTLQTGGLRDEDPRIAEINAFDPSGHRIYVVNPSGGVLDVIDVSTPTSPLRAASLDIVTVCEAALGAASCPVEEHSEPNSVVILGNLMAVAIANAVRTSNGHAVFFELNGINPPSLIAVHEVGALPDMITFTADGDYALVANEGEPSSYHQPDSIDPPGSVSVIRIDRLGTAGAVRQVGFERFDNRGQRQKLEHDDVRIFGPNATVSQDLEPEYIATDGNKAYVSLQENNAMAIINIQGRASSRSWGWD